MLNKCENCKNHCCSKNFIGLANSFKHSNGDLFNQILLSDEEADNIISKYGDEYIDYIDGLPYVSLNEDRSCKALKNGKCSIDNARPDVCKLYPYYFDPFGGIFVDKNCPCFKEADFDKRDVFNLINKRVQLFAKLEGKLHGSERFAQKVKPNTTKEDLLNKIKNIDFVNIKNNMLYINNKNMLEIAEKYSTPLSIGFVDIIERRIKELKTSFDNAIKQYGFKGAYKYAYATKANYFSEVVRTSLKNADMLEFSSEYDIDLLFQLIKLRKFDFSKTVICNGIKTQNYFKKLEKLSAKGVRFFVIIDDIEEYETIKKYNIKNCSLGLRYNCEMESRVLHNTYDNFDIGENRFGLDKKSLESLLNRINKENIFNCTLFHFHFGGKITNVSNYLKAFEMVVDYFISLKQKFSNLQCLDFGGGFPSKLGKIDIDNLVEKMMEILSKKQKISSLNFDIIGEHGRYTTEEHGVYLFKVEKRHKSNNKSWYFINGSLMQNLPDMWGLKEDFIILPVNGWNKKLEVVYLGGETCDEDDKFFVNNRNKQILLPQTSDDLYLAIIGVGAYQEMISGDSCFSHCMIPKSNELVIYKDKIKFFKHKRPIKEKLKRLSYTKDYLKNF